MGLLSKIFGKKEEKKKTTNPKNIDDEGLTEAELTEACGHTPESDWCPKVEVPPIQLPSKSKEGQIKTSRKGIGR